jgi:hypothetical protein
MNFARFFSEDYDFCHNLFFFNSKKINEWKIIWKIGLRQHKLKVWGLIRMNCKCGSQFGKKTKWKNW